MQFKYITIGVIHKKYQQFWVPITKVLRFRSLKMAQNLLKFWANLLKNCVNYHYVFYHNFNNDLNSETSEPILERRKIGLQHILK